jgi:hypothetical protein
MSRDSGFGSRRRQSSKDRYPLPLLTLFYYLVGCGHRSVHSLGIVLPVAVAIGSAGGGSAQTVSAVGKMAKAAINPQLKNLRIIKTKSGVSL